MKNRFSKVQNEVYKFTRVQKIMISVCAFLLIIGGILRFTGGNAASKAGYGFVTMLRYTLIENPAKTLTSAADDLSKLWKVKDENEELRQKLALQQNYKTESEELKRRLKEKEALDDITSLLEYEKISVNVIARDVQVWSNELTVDKGSNQGVKLNTAVISSKGLVGRVSDVQPNTSKIQLLTTENGDNSVAIKVELENGKTVEGILENYDKDKGSYKVSIYDSNVEIKPNMKIVTSGIGGVFPPGIYVGKVSSIEDLYNAKGKVVYAKPAADFNDFVYLCILGNEQ